MWKKWQNSDRDFLTLTWFRRRLALAEPRTGRLRGPGTEGAEAQAGPAPPPLPARGPGHTRHGLRGPAGYRHGFEATETSHTPLPTLGEKKGPVQNRDVLQEKWALFLSKSDVK